MTAPLPPTPGNQNGMHPQDKKNLLIFVCISLAMWFAFDHFVLSPRTDAIKQAQQQAALQSAQVAISDPKTDMDQILPREERLQQTERLPIDAAEVKGSLSLKGGGWMIFLSNMFTPIWIIPIRLC